MDRGKVQGLKNSIGGLFIPKIVILGSCSFQPYIILALPNKLNPELYKRDHEAAYKEACEVFYPAIDECDEVWIYAPEGFGKYTLRDVEYARKKGKKIFVLRPMGREGNISDPKICK